jgi:hypothetical protein
VFHNQCVPGLGWCEPIRRQESINDCQGFGYAIQRFRGFDEKAATHVNAIPCHWRSTGPQPDPRGGYSLTHQSVRWRSAGFARKHAWTRRSQDLSDVEIVQWGFRHGSFMMGRPIPTEDIDDTKKMWGCCLLTMLQSTKLRTPRMWTASKESREWLKSTFHACVYDDVYLVH